MNFKTFFIGCYIFCATVSAATLFAQKTAVYSPPQSTFANALDLFEKTKYGSAITIFDELAKQDSRTLNADAEYYAALCACDLQHLDATKRLENFISHYPENLHVNRAWLKLGHRYFDEHSYRDALLEYAKVNTYGLSWEQKDELYFKQGYSFLKTNVNSKASEAFLQIKDKPNKYQIPATYYYGHIAFEEGRYETAMQHFERISDDPVYRNEIVNYLVHIYFKQNNYDKLIETAAPIIKYGDDDKKNAGIIRLTAGAYFQKGEYNKALEYFERYVKAKPAKMLREDSYEMAFASYKTGNYKQAITHFQNVAQKQDTLSQNAYYHLGDCYLKTGEKRYAYNAFNSAQKIKADECITEEALFNYAKLAVELSYNPYNEAVTSLQKYLQEYPKSNRRDEALGYLSDLYLVTNNYKSAQESLDKITKRSTRFELAYQKISYYRGIELFNENNFSEALPYFTKAKLSDFDPKTSAAAIYWAGESQYRLGKWNEARMEFMHFLQKTQSTLFPFSNMANYNLAYANFKLERWGEAASSFQKYLSEKPIDNKIATDAALRHADCRFMQKDYNGAIEGYKKVISRSNTDADYATYQMALANGASGDLQTKINNLRSLLSNYPKSTFTDDALYELGTTYTLVNNNEEAKKAFQRVVKEHSQSTHARKSLLKVGLVDYNQDKNMEALATLKKVVKDYSGTSEAGEALATIKNIYVEMNQVDDYVDYAKDIPQADISRNEQDQLTFSAAENLYMNGDCEKATGTLAKYIQRFPDGNHISKAHFYKAECDYHAQRMDEALISYNFVLKNQRISNTPTAALRAARINYVKQNYEAALEHYILLEEVADQTSLTTDALSGEMLCNYALKNYGLAIQSAQKLLELPKLPENLVTDAHFTIARSAYALNNNDLAAKEFDIVLKKSQNESGAESKYMLALMQFNNNNLDVAEKMCVELSEKFTSYDYWVAKGFILLADVYVKRGNTFQAMQTLQSIIDNYEGQDLVTIAREKLNAIP